MHTLNSISKSTKQTGFDDYFTLKSYNTFVMYENFVTTTTPDKTYRSLRYTFLFPPEHDLKYIKIKIQTQKRWQLGELQ